MIWRLLIIAFVIIVISASATAQTIISATATTQTNNSVYIDQVGDNNSYSITQEGSGHSVNILVGKTTQSDNNTIAITQQGTGAKSASVELPSGVNNGIVIFQDGSGNHTTGIINFAGTANNVNVNQNGDGNHQFVVTGAPGTTNSGNTITATQSGGQGADKQFNLNMYGTTGATVTVQQTNPTQANSGAMSIQCSTGCGSYSYIRN